MHSIFLEIKSVIPKALIDIKQGILDSIEFETLIATITGLKSVKVGLEKLCSRDVTLLNSEATFTFAIWEIKQQNSGFSKNLKYSIVCRINERCNVNLVGLMQCLSFGWKCDAATVTDDLSRFPSKHTMIQQDKSNMRKLLHEESKSLVKLSTLRRRKHRNFGKQIINAGQKN